MANWNVIRAEFHGRRLARERVKLTDSLIGNLGFHEGADTTVASMREFSDALRVAYNEVESDLRKPNAHGPRIDENSYEQRY